MAEVVHRAYTDTQLAVHTAHAQEYLSWRKRWRTTSHSPCPACRALDGVTIGVDEAFDPDANAQYAARFLASLKSRLGGWPEAVAAYHSMDPARGERYRTLVYASWKGAPMSGYPPSLKVLEEGVKDAKATDGKQLYFLRRVPRDPFADDSEKEAVRTWGLRSYASPPDDPKDGDDVFDVYSRSKQTGLNGVPYREW